MLDQIRAAVAHRLVLTEVGAVLHEQIGELLDQDGHAASAAEIRSWLNSCTVRWRQSDDPTGLKAE